MATKVQAVVGWKGLTTNWTANRGALTWKYRLAYKNLAAAAGTDVLDITGFPGGMAIRGAFLYLVANFTGGGAGSSTLKVGTTGTDDAYIASTSVFTGAGTAIVGKTLVPGTFLNASAPTGLGTVRVTLGANVNTNLLTAGAADLYLILAAHDLRLS